MIVSRTWSIEPSKRPQSFLLVDGLRVLSPPRNQTIRDGNRTVAFAFFASQLSLVKIHSGLSLFWTGLGGCSVATIQPECFACSLVPGFYRMPRFLAASCWQWGKWRNPAQMIPIEWHVVDAPLDGSFLILCGMQYSCSILGSRLLLRAFRRKEVCYTHPLPCATRTIVKFFVNCREHVCFVNSLLLKIQLHYQTYLHS